MRYAVPTSVLLLALGLLYPMQRWIDANSRREILSDETLYFASGETIKKMSLGLNGLVADMYWIRTVQYFGRKLLEAGPRVKAGSTKDIRMDLLAPLLKIIVSLDPQHIPAYRFAAIFLPERDFAAAVGLLERGITENPAEWRLYQDLGYIYWQSGDYAKAAEIYDQGGRIPGSMWWMRDLAGLMRIRGASREAARAIYSGYLTDDDPRIREQAATRLKQLQSLDELDVINGLIEHYKQQTGACPGSLRQLARQFHSIGLRLNEDFIPVDPDGFAYVLDSGTCRAQVGSDSPVPR